MRTWRRQHPVAVSGNRPLIGETPIQPALLQRVEPVMKMLAIGPHRLRRMRAAGDGGKLEQIAESRLDNRHPRVEQDGKAYRNPINTGRRPYNRNHPALRRQGTRRRKRTSTLSRCLHRRQN